MARYLKLEELRSEGPVEVGQLHSGDVIVGREPEPAGITLSSKAVSRNQGIFSRVRNHWFYRDLGSTNGSWVNGTQVKPDRWCIVRNGSVLQFADLLVRVSSVGDSLGLTQQSGGVAAIGARSLIVFSGHEFVDEFLIPEYGRALAIGGAQADLQLEGDIFEQPSLVVERRGDKICAFGLVKDIELRHNDQPVSGTISLVDGDIIRVGNFSVLLNDPGRASAVPGSPESVSPLKDWLSNSGANEMEAEEARGAARSATRALSAFGKAPVEEEGLDETMALDPDMMEANRRRRDMHPSMRYALGGGGKGAFGTLEDKVILLAGIVLFCVLMGFALWWIFA